jgi:pimeloyl-ACP methyl ester carboxylesterase
MAKPASSLERTTLSIADVELELFQGGEGPPVLYLHSAQGTSEDDPFLAQLAREFRVVAPSHPGFGRSSLPEWLDAVDDIAHVYLELICRLGLDRLDLVGCSIGGWIAAEIATKVPEKIAHLVMVGPVGVKTGPSDRLDVPDVFGTAHDKLGRLLFHDPDKHRPDPTKLSDEQITIMVRNRETLALMAWEPYMHNPKLKHRLFRVKAPALFVRGESDGLVSAEYLDRYAALLPQARIATIPKAGNAVQIEQPGALAKQVLAFLKQ